MKFCGYILLLSLFVSGCYNCDSHKDSKEAEPIYSFAVAGHIYGHSQRYTNSVYPPFKKIIAKDIGKEAIDFLVLTGDLVPFSVDSNWIKVNEELNDLGVPWYIARGNHDLGPVMTEITGKSDFTAFTKENDLFLILNTTNPGWTVDSVQNELIADQLKNTDSINKIFVFSHQLWWLRNSPVEFKLDSITTNSNGFYEGESDFWKQTFPLFENIGKPVWFFAGDLGAHELFQSYYEDHYQNYHFYASGVGSGIRDNYLLVSVYENGKVTVLKREF